MPQARSLPKYRIVEDFLRQQIADGVFPVDSLLPTEEELRRRFGVSRATVRTALANIQKDGLISRSAAVGSRVIALQARKDFQAGWNSVEELLQYTKTIHLKVETIDEIVVDAAQAEALRFAEGRGLVKVVGRRWRDGDADPLCQVEIFFDELYKGISDGIRAAGRPVADLIEEQYAVRIETIRQEINADLITADEAAKLHCQPGTAALVVVRWYHDSSGRMFQTTRTRYPADRFRYVLEFGRASNQSPV